MSVLMVPRLLYADAISLSTLFNADFSASQSLWRGGPTAGLDERDRTSGDVGLYYDVRANTGTVTATQNAGVQVSYVSETTAGSLTNIQLGFVGDPNGGSISSAFGAQIQSGVFLDACIGVETVFGCAGVPVDQDIPIFIDRGFFLDPTNVHTPALDVQVSANDAAVAFGAGVGPTIPGFGTLGPTMNLDLDQTIFFTPTGLTGTAVYQNQATGETGSTAFSVPTSSLSNLQLNLGAGVWDISFQNVLLTNTFRNDINLELRPAFDYFVGSWPPPGSGLFSFGLVDETFSLSFNQIATLGSIQVEVVDSPTTVPEPGSLALLTLGIGALMARRRKVRIH
jgi:hypothetical protein